MPFVYGTFEANPSKQYTTKESVILFASAFNSPAIINEATPSRLARALGVLHPKLSTLTQSDQLLGVIKKNPVAISGTLGSAIATGFYDPYATYSDSPYPSMTKHAVLFVIKGQWDILQIIAYDNSDIYMRTANITGGTSSISWGSWKKVGS